MKSCMGTSQKWAVSIPNALFRTPKSPLWTGLQVVDMAIAVQDPPVDEEVQMKAGDRDTYEPSLTPGDD